jgi:hypothetical protein
MKKLLIILLLFLFQKSNAQSITIRPNGLQNYVIKNSVGKGFEHIAGPSSLGTYLTSDAAWFQTNYNDNLSIGPKTDGTYGFTFKTDGNTQVSSKIKFGSDAPTIFFYNYIGTTSSSQGGVVTVDINGLLTEIISASLIVDCGAAGYVPDNYSFTNGYQVQLQIRDNEINISNVAGNSINILNKPFKLLITLK